MTYGNDLSESRTYATSNLSHCRPSPHASSALRCMGMIYRGRVRIYKAGSGFTRQGRNLRGKVGRHESLRGRVGRHESLRGRVGRHESLRGKGGRHETLRGKVGRHESLRGKVGRHSHALQRGALGQPCSLASVEQRVRILRG